MKKCFSLLAISSILVAAAPAAAFNINFCTADPSTCYCDGLNISNYFTGVAGEKVFAGNQTGCGSEGMVGLKVTNPITKFWRYVVAMEYETSNTTEIFVVRKNGTWALYGQVTGELINSGLWFYGYPTTEAATRGPAAQR